MRISMGLRLRDLGLYQLRSALAEALSVLLAQDLELGTPEF